MEKLKKLEDIENRAKFAKANGCTRQTLNKRISSGWAIDVLNGKEVMYNPNNVFEIVHPS